MESNRPDWHDREAVEQFWQQWLETSDRPKDPWSIYSVRSLMGSQRFVLLRHLSEAGHEVPTQSFEEARSTRTMDAGWLTPAMLEALARIPQDELEAAWWYAHTYAVDLADQGYQTHISPY